MAYEKQNFVDGQVLEAEHLNHIEDGVVANENAIAKCQPKGNYLTEHQPIKTINGESVVGEGDIEVGGVSSWNDLTDKPFGEERVEGECEEYIFICTELTGGEYDEEYDGYVWNGNGLLGDIPIHVGATYRLEIGEVNFYGVAQNENEIGYYPFEDVCQFYLNKSEDILVLSVDEEGNEASPYDSRLFYAGNTVKKLDPKYLPEDIGGVSSWDDLTDKPFGEVSEYSLLASHSFSGSTTELRISGIYGTFDAKVVFDGEEYFFKNFGEGVFGGVGYPFEVYSYFGGGAVGYFFEFTCEDGDHTVEIYQKETVIKKIDEKYLPSTGGAGLVVWFYEDEFGLATETAPAVIENAVRSGKPVIGIHEEDDVFTHVYTFGGVNEDGYRYFYGFVDGHLTTLTYNDDHAYTKETI